MGSCHSVRYTIQASIAEAGDHYEKIKRRIIFSIIIISNSKNSIRRVPDKDTGV